MSNIASAQAAIEAELTHAKQGVAYFQHRIEALNDALAKLADIDSIGGATSNKHVSLKLAGKRGPKAGNEKAVKATKSTGYKGPKGRNELPFTGGSYWSDLVTEEPQSGADILHAAIASLGFEPTREQVKKLALRSTFALNALVKAEKIQDSGSGRERRFFKQ